MLLVYITCFLLGWKTGSFIAPHTVPHLPRSIILMAQSIRPYMLPLLPNSKSSMPIKLAVVPYLACLVGGVTRKRVDKLGRQTYVLWYDFKGNRHNVYTDKDGKWVFHGKLTSDSTGNFPPVPRQSYHRFHAKLSTFGGCGGMSGKFAMEQSELVGLAKF